MRISEDNPEEEQILRDLWEDETQREMVIEGLKADCEVRTGGLRVFEETYLSGGVCKCGGA